MAAGGGIGKGEKGHDAAGCTCGISVIEVVDVWRVEVHRLFHSAQTEDAGEERIGGSRRGGERGDVVKTLDLREHGGVP